MNAKVFRSLRTSMQVTLHTRQLPLLTSRWARVVRRRGLELAAAPVTRARTGAAVGLFALCFVWPSPAAAQLTGSTCQRFIDADPSSSEPSEVSCQVRSRQSRASVKGSSSSTMPSQQQRCRTRPAPLVATTCRSASTHLEPSRR